RLQLGRFEAPLTLVLVERGRASGRPLPPPPLDELMAEMADREIAHGGVQIALEPIDAQSPALFPQRGEDIVHQLLRDVARVHVAEGEFAQRRMVGTEGALERRRIARANTRTPVPLLSGERQCLRVDT